MRLLGLLILIFPPMFGLALIIFPIHTLYFLYRIVELVCKPFGDECREKLKLRYENLGENPKAYKKTHPLYVIYCRAIGFLIVLTYVWLLTLP